MNNTNYQVTINMSVETLTALKKSGAYLYGFKAVKSSDQAGRPLVWLKTQNYSVSSIIEWTDQYQAYTSNSPIAAHQTIDVGFSIGIMPGQVLNVEEGGSGKVMGGGKSSEISIFNITNTQFTCGLLEMQKSTAMLLCAFPLYGNHLETIAPIEKVLLMFSTNSVNTGTVIESSIQQSLAYLDSMDSYSPGILIDLTGNSNNQRSLSYDINKGWDWGGYNWAKSIPANADLVPFLIEPS